MSAYRFFMSGGSDIMLTSRYERAKFYSVDSFNDLVDFLLENRGRLDFSPMFRKQVDYVLDGQAAYSWISFTQWRARRV